VKRPDHQRFANAPLRVVTIDNAPWFVAKDVCRVLELKGYPSQHTAKLDRDEIRNIPVSHAQNMRLTSLFDDKVPVVALTTESGLYKLIMRSDKPQAKPFQDWVTKVVLPAIRKDGMYIKGEETLDVSTDEGLMQMALLVQKGLTAKIERLMA
jgi:prophage antirepressor-like protein